MAGYNRIIIVGNLTRDPEYKQLNNGQAVCRLAVASNRQFRSKQSGEMVQEVCYIDVDVWGAQAESCRQYLAKGRPVLVEGRIKFDSWQDQEGKTRSKHSIVADTVVFLSSASENQDSYNAATTTNLQNDTDELEPRNEVERALKAQLDDIKNRKKDAAAKPAAFGATKVAAAKKKEDVPAQEQVAQAMKNDESPFDDLPF